MFSRLVRSPKTAREHREPQRIVCRLSVAIGVQRSIGFGDLSLQSSGVIEYDVNRRGTPGGYDARIYQKPLSVGGDGIGVLEIASARALGVEQQHVCSVIPCVRHRSDTFRAASPSLTIARICSSLNLLRFIGPPFNGGPHSTRGGSEGAGQNHPLRSRATTIQRARR
jgi:hypothetical protein